MKQKMLDRYKVIYLVTAITAWMFISLRLNAFIYQVTSKSYPSYAHVFIILIGVIFLFLTYDKIHSFLKEYCPGIKYIIVALASIFITFAGRKTLIYSAIDGTAINSHIVLLISVAGGGILLSIFLMVLFRAVKCAALEAVSRLRSLSKLEWLFIVIVLAVLNISVKLYSHYSYQIFFWDNSGYWETTHTLAQTLRESWSQFFRDIYDSVFSTDYNYIIALPGSLLCAIFGKSRYVFLAGIVNLYVFPFCVMVYLFIKNKSSKPIVTTVCVFLLLPILIFLNLVGFIDVAGAPVCFLALVLYLRSRKNDRSELWEYFLIGCLLALAILLRRWYAFFALSFVIAALVDGIIFKRSLYKFFAMLFPLAFILLFFFQTFVSLKLLDNYGQMYSAYQMGLSFDFALVRKNYGLLAPSVLIIFSFILMRKRQIRYIGCFIIIQLALCFIIFVSTQSHGQQHLLLYLPGFIYLASLLFSKIIGRFNKKIAVSAICLAASALFTINCLIRTDYQSKTLPPSLSLYPEVRQDIKNILEINSYLDQLVEGTDKQVGVLASSLTMNREILTNAEISISLSSSYDIDRSYLAHLPAVDSRDDLPYSVLYCDYILVCSPVQTHLGEQKQQVVVVPANSFLEGRDIAGAFTLNKEFYISADNITVYIYEKVRDITAEEEAEFFARLEEALGG